MRGYTVPIILLAWAAYTLLEGGAMTVFWALLVLVALLAQADHLRRRYRNG